MGGTTNLLHRENNQAAGKTWVYTYDNAGNITGKKEYAYTTGAVGTLEKENTYTYGDDSWGDLLTGYNGQEFITDEIGNILNDGVWSYIWQHGRQLAQMQTSGDDFETIIDFKYSADGLRTEKVVTTRTNGFTQHIVTYRYVYNGSKLVQETVTTETIEDNTITTEVLYYAYDASGNPLSLTLTDASGAESTYYYAVNIQGDVAAILTTSGTAVVEYTYDAWGNPLTATGTLSDTLGETNSLRYCGYIYDQETGYYYLRSRYYNPELGRFINADSYASTGQGLLGNNMFTYCLNNPTNRYDSEGNVSEKKADKIIADNADAIIAAGEEFDIDPVIIAACIYAEQVRNVNFLDSFDFVLHFHFGLDTSIGIGQVKVSTAQMLEDKGYIEKTKRSGSLIFGNTRNQNIALKLEDDSENIRYVAAYLRYWVDTWRDTLDISHRPDILATLYNLGTHANSPNTSPRPNPFGQYAKRKYSHLEEILTM